MRKRLLSMMLAVGMVLTILPASAFATEDGGRPSARDWFSSNRQQQEQTGEQGGEEYTSDPAPSMYSEMVQSAPISQSDKPIEGMFLSNNESNSVYFSLDDEGTVIIYGKGSIKTDLPLGYYDMSDENYDDNGNYTGMPGYGSPFSGNDNIKNIFIDNGITDIPEGLFENCTNLTTVTMADSITYIGDHAFKKCINLTAITIAESVTYIGDHAFEDCYRLGTVNFSNNVTSIGAYAFANCSTSNLIVDHGDGTGSYSGFTSELLTSIVIPDSVTSIGEHAFDGCDELRNVTLPKHLTSIADYMFKGCDSLTQITIPNGVTKIGSYAFYECPIANFTIPNQVTTIGDYAFSECTFENIMLPNSVTSIGTGAFARCENLTNIEIPNSVTSIGAETFMLCTKLTSVTISNKVDTIESHTFSECIALTNIFIPTSVKSIKYGAFVGCETLSNVYYGGDETQWKAISFPEMEPGMPNNAKIHFDSTRIGSSNNEQTLNGSVEYLYKWDKADRRVYFGSNRGIGYFVDNSVAASDFNSIDQFVDKYVLVKINPKQATTITAIHPVESKIGTCSAVGADMMTIDGIDYSYPTNNSLVLDLYTGKEVLYHLSEGNIVGASILDSKTGTLEAWDSASGQATIDGIVYSTNFLSSIANIEQMVQKKVTYKACNSYDFNSLFEVKLTSVNQSNSTAEKCGDNLTWKLSNGTLTISGEGKMFDFDPENGFNPPWWNSKITSIIIESGVTTIGNYAFRNKRSVTSIYFKGNVPTFEKNAFSPYLIAIVFYPGNNSTWSGVDFDNLNFESADIIFQSESVEIADGTKIKLSDTWSFENLTNEMPRSLYNKFISTNYGLATGSLLSLYYNCMKTFLYNDGSKGNCFGMNAGVVTSYYGYPSASSYNSKYTHLCNVKADDKSSQTQLTASELIMYGQMLQTTYLISKQKKEVLDLQELYDIVSNYVYEDGMPVDISISDGKDARHELLALSLSDCEDYSVIGVYDCNYPNTIRPLYLYKSNGGFTRWEYRYKGTQTWSGNTKESGILTCRFDDTLYKVLEDKGVIEPEECKLILTDSKSFKVATNKKAVTVKQYDSTDTDIVIPVCYSASSTADSESASKEMYLYWVKADDQLQFSDLESESSIYVASGDNGIAVESMPLSLITMNLSDKNSEKSIQVKLLEDNEQNNNKLKINYYRNDGDGDLCITTIDATTDAEMTSSQNKNKIVVSGVRDIRIQTSNDTIEQLNLNKDVSYQVETNKDGKIETIKEDINSEGEFSNTVYSSNSKFTNNTANKSSVKNSNAGFYVRTSSRPVQTSPAQKDMNKKNDSAEAVTQNKIEWSNPFADIDEKAWYYPAVRYVGENSLMTGAENSYTFAPNANLSRAMLAQILYNKEGKPAVTKGSGFGDVSTGAWYEDAVTWASEKGIVSGYEDGRFAPNDPVTREQLVVMLWRYFDSPSAEGLLAFTDVGAIRGYAQEAMTWAVREQIISGYEDYSLRPADTANRVQVAQILKSCME